MVTKTVTTNFTIPLDIYVTFSMILSFSHPRKGLTHLQVGYHQLGPRKFFPLQQHEALCLKKGWAEFFCLVPEAALKGNVERTKLILWQLCTISIHVYTHTHTHTHTHIYIKWPHVNSDKVVWFGLVCRIL